MSILNEFFYGNLTPYEYRQSKETKAMNAKVLDDEEALIGNLPESEQAKRDLLEELFRDRTTLTALLERDAYIEGFKAGARFMLEILS
ncbi:DUF6809 family protein [Ruminococcus sp.]|uniref:DUF6809 family protein n=1 Tax=Ruminococcus sp. TaxID=41978 RepID=UPI00388EE23A